VLTCADVYCRPRLPCVLVLVSSITTRLLQALVVLQSGQQKYALRDLKRTYPLFSLSILLSSP
jgi:hypothetical protein